MQQLNVSYSVWESVLASFATQPPLHHVYGGNAGTHDFVRVYFRSGNDPGSILVFCSQISGADEIDWSGQYTSTARASYDDALAAIFQEVVDIPPSLVGFRNSVSSAVKGVSAGQVSTSATSRVIVRNTTYTQTATDRVRSIRSDNAADTSAGTGARTVRITYLRTDFSGPYTEDKTLNGTSWVDTTDTHMTYIESIEVLTVGSGSANAGTITLNDNTGGTGSTMCTMVIGNKRIFYGHHFVATGKTCTLMGLSGSGDGVAAQLVVQWTDLSVSTAASREVCGVRLPPAQQNMDRPLRAPINIPGPAMIAAYVQPASSTAAIYRAELDYYER